MTTERIEEYRRFNKVINPEGKAIYHFKETLKYSTHFPKLYTFEEFIEEVDKEPLRTPSVMLNLVRTVFIDVDDPRAQKTIRKFLEGYKYIEISSVQEGRSHIYMKVGNFPEIRQCRLCNLEGLHFHDWFRFCSESSMAPNLPSKREPTRKFLQLPDEIDEIPRFLFTEERGYET